MLNYEKVTSKNLKIAIKIQNLIFPLEKNSSNFEMSINQKKFPKCFKILKSITYWLVKKNNTYVGITGIYSYIKNPKTSWLGWFGVIPTERRKNFGSQIFEWTIQEAKKIGYKNFRIYTSLEMNEKGVAFYRSKDFLEEKYTTEKNLSDTILIFSKSLTLDKIDLWNNKMLNITFLEEN